MNFFSNTRFLFLFAFNVLSHLIVVQLLFYSVREGMALCWETSLFTLGLFRLCYLWPLLDAFLSLFRR